MAITVRLNGAERHVAAATVDTLIAELKLPGAPRGIAVAINGTVVPRAHWATQDLRAGDAIEVVRAAQGG